MMLSLSTNRGHLMILVNRLIMLSLWLTIEAIKAKLIDIEKWLRLVKARLPCLSIWILLKRSLGICLSINLLRTAQIILA